MAGFFAAAAKTPFSTLVIVSEMTGGYRLLLPSLWVCGLSYILSDEQSIYSSQVDGRARSPAHQGSYVQQVLADVRVNDFLSSGQSTPLLHPNDSLSTVLSHLSTTSIPVLPVVSGDDRLLGVVNLEEVHLASQLPFLTPLVLAEDLMRTGIQPLTPNDTLDRALELFVENDLLILPVVNDLKERRVIGMVRRFDISSAYVRRLHAPRDAECGKRVGA
jgi:CIC family chloride channel protein